MITDNLSGAKGNTQSSAIIWLSLDPSLSLSGASWHHPIANPLVSLPHQCSQSCWFPFTPLFTPSAPEPKAQSHSISSYYTLQTFILLLLLSLLCRIVTLLISFCIMFIAILWSIAILCIVVHCVNYITIV